MDQARGSGTAWSILAALKWRGGATVAALSEEFGLSGMAVRHHLAALKGKGLLTSHNERRGVGRPTEVFSLTEQGDELFPRHYDALANDILLTLQTIEGKEKTDAVFRGRAQRQLEEHSKRLTGLSFDEKVSVVAQILTDEGYLAELEKRGDEYLLTEHNCAVNRIAHNFNQVCQCELSLIADLLNADVERRQHIIDGDTCCSYSIKPKPRTKPRTKS